MWCSGEQAAVRLNLKAFTAALYSRLTPSISDCGTPISPGSKVRATQSNDCHSQLRDFCISPIRRDLSDWHDSEQLGVTYGRHNIPKLGRQFLRIGRNHFLRQISDVGCGYDHHEGANLRLIKNIQLLG